VRVGVAPVAPDRIRPIEVWEHRDVEELRAGGGRGGRRGDPGAPLEFVGSPCRRLRRRTVARRVC